MVIHPDISDNEDSDDSETDNDSIRDKKVYPVYLDDELREKVDELFRKYNAHREIDDKEKVEKNKHFNQGLIEAALRDADWESHVERRFEETSE